MKTQLYRIATLLISMGLMHVFVLLPVIQAEEVGIKGVADGAIAVDIITGIDKDSRSIILKNEAGEESTFTAGPEVRNFDQLKRGDLVMMEYYQGLAVALEPKGSGLEERISEVSFARAKKGDKPGMEVTASTYAAAEVAAVDTENRLVRLEGPQGSLIVKAADDINLSQVEVGQEIEALYVESFAVSVVPAPKVSGTVSMKFTSIALGVGVQWGEGTLVMYDGTSHDFNVKGLTLVDVGASSVEATGKVYNLVESKDLEGTFLVGEAGAALVGGGSAVAMKNRNGVLMKLQSIQKGVRLTLAGAGLKVTFK